MSKLALKVKVSRKELGALNKRDIFNLAKVLGVSAKRSEGITVIADKIAALNSEVTVEAESVKGIEKYVEVVNSVATQNSVQNNSNKMEEEVNTMKVVSKKVMGNKTVKELKVMAKALGVKGYSALNKQPLVDAILAAQKANLVSTNEEVVSNQEAQAPVAPVAPVEDSRNKFVDLRNEGMYCEYKGKVFKVLGAKGAIETIEGKRVDKRVTYVKSLDNKVYTFPAVWFQGKSPLVKNVKGLESEKFQTVLNKAVEVLRHAKAELDTARANKQFRYQVYNDANGLVVIDTVTGECAPAYDLNALEQKHFAFAANKLGVKVANKKATSQNKTGLMNTNPRKTISNVKCECCNRPLSVAEVNFIKKHNLPQMLCVRCQELLGIKSVKQQATKKPVATRPANLPTPNKKQRPAKTVEQRIAELKQFIATQKALGTDASKKNVINAEARLTALVSGTTTTTNNSANKSSKGNDQVTPF